MHWRIIPYVHSNFMYTYFTVGDAAVGTLTLRVPLLMTNHMVFLSPSSCRRPRHTSGLSMLNMDEAHRTFTSDASRNWLPKIDAYISRFQDQPDFTRNETLIGPGVRLSAISPNRSRLDFHDSLPPPPPPPVNHVSPPLIAGQLIYSDIANTVTEHWNTNREVYVTDISYTKNCFHQNR